ncbi:hypothetical protein O71_07856 [Pontibacter sp. BAB1700]|nr:hypothetical protein O71_07856 [Pontibacter sp. BAB1700]
MDVPKSFLEVNLLDMAASIAKVLNCLDRAEIILSPEGQSGLIVQPTINKQQFILQPSAIQQSPLSYLQV